MAASAPFAPAASALRLEDRVGGGINCACVGQQVSSAPVAARALSIPVTRSDTGREAECLNHPSLGLPGHPDRLAPPRLAMSPGASPAARTPRLGDASLRPAEYCVVVPATPEFQAESALLSTNGVVAWLDDARQDVSCQQVTSELTTALGAQ
ncbi:hypothetical protein ZWY2020_051224 [Hordeum vulgare]|nr:hypothetical protein ZWY2020_051224 [Hordeum vulgare]